MFEKYVYVTFVYLMFVLFLNKNLGNQNFIYKLIFLRKIGPGNLFGLKYLVDKKYFFEPETFLDPPLHEFFFLGSKIL